MIEMMCCRCGSEITETYQKEHFNCVYGPTWRTNTAFKVKAEAHYGFAGTDMTFEEAFDDDVTDEEIEETMRDMVMEQVD